MRTIYIILYPVVMLEWLYNPLGISFNARILGDGKYDEKPHAGWDHSLMKTTSREPSWVTVQGQKTFTESTPKKKTEHLAILCTFHHPASSNKTCSNIYFTPWHKIVNLSRIKCNHAWCRLVIRYAPKKNNWLQHLRQKPIVPDAKMCQVTKKKVGSNPSWEAGWFTVEAAYSWGGAVVLMRFPARMSSSWMWKNVSKPNLPLEGLQFDTLTCIMSESVNLLPLWSANMSVSNKTSQLARGFKVNLHHPPASRVV